MNFNVNLVLFCVLLITKQYLTAKECVQRRLGACRTLTRVGLDLDQLYNPQPDDFLFKTSMEVNLLENKHSFENNMLLEKKRPVTFNLDNAAIINIHIGGSIGFITITLGQKYYRLVELGYRTRFSGFNEKKYNRYTPILPTFPYDLHLQITKNGTFSIYADGNNEPFLEYQHTELSKLRHIGFENQGQNDLIAFVDCSVKYKPNCGVHHVEKLYGCREWFVEKQSQIRNFEGFQKSYGKEVLFDEIIVVDAEHGWSTVKFTLKPHLLYIDFKVNHIEAALRTFYRETLKTVRTEQWFEIPEHPYAVRVLLTTSEKDTFLKISNLRNNTILSMNLCGYMGKLQSIWFSGPKLYFDCFTSDDKTIMSERPRKTVEMKSSPRINPIQYHENGYNYTKTFMDTRDFVSKPFTIYQYNFGNTTQDWCPYEPKPELLVTLKYNEDSLEGLIERSNRELLSELKKINAQNNATIDINAAILTELKKVSGTADINAAILTELKAISNALATPHEQNITTVNDYYNNQLNVTDLKQN